MDYKEKFISLINNKTLPIEQRKKLEEIYNSSMESEDERIRKALINFFNDSYCHDAEISDNCEVTVSEALIWLEKQGKQKTFDYENVDVQQKDFAPKSEPKFKVGDWIVLSASDGEKVVQIDSIEYFKSGQPRYITSEGRWFGNGTKAHLWTIQDAKDGDVLISQYNKPFIYNGNLNSFHIGSYCGISIEGRFNVAIEKCRWTENRNIYPATKEQRDILFEKMREAGYEWEEDKKELNKIEKQGEKEEVDGFDAELNALLKKYEHLPKEQLLESMNFYVDELEKQWRDEI